MGINVLLDKLEAKGYEVAMSRFFDGVAYTYDSTGLTILAGKNGKLQINWNNIDDLIEELMDFQEAYG